MLSAAQALVQELRRSGAEVDVEDGILRVTAPPGVLTHEIKLELAERKAEVLALFTESIQLLNQRGVRIISRDGSAFALWRDADGREVRDALEALGHGDAQVLYLDDPVANIPERCRQFVPEYVKSIWAGQGLLASPAERLEAEARAMFLNRLFDTLGTAPSPSRITGATVLHGRCGKPT